MKAKLVTISYCLGCVCFFVGTLINYYMGDD